MHLFARVPKVYNPWFVAVVATLGGALFGFDISSMSAIITSDQYLTYFNKPKGVQQGGINSALAAGSVIGSIMAGPVSNKFGRRDAIVFAVLWWLVGTAVQTGTNGVGSLIAGRVLNGVCVGITSSQVPVYLAEIARKEKRGQLVIVQQLAIEWGILIMFFIGYGCTFISGPSASFRTAWGIQFVPATLLLIGLPFLPESPRWLAKVDRVDEAIDVLAKIQAGGDRKDPLVVAEWEEITETLAAERQAAPGWRKFVYNGMWKRTIAGFTVQMWQQNSGANVMTYYVVYIFEMAGLTGNVNLVASGVQYALFIIFTTVMFFYVDKIGRRPLLIYGALAMGACHFIVGGLLSTGAKVSEVDNDPNITIQLFGPKANTVIAFCYLLIIIYALTLAPVAWIYAAEIWSLETRAVGMSISATGNWLFNFALGLYIPPGFINIRYGMFIVFGLMCILAAIQFYFTYPETAGKSLEEIELMFAHGGPKAWKTKRGHSRLDTLVDQAREKHLTVEEITAERLGSLPGANNSTKHTEENVEKV
ncbi:MFS transporter [Myriangium duriaei CBS 260.36]|uniref:MFS transporter n=1 Tax=Myriangium duriaei CBS 260.36 TaxID=1168546 RepID=A0A9P4J200_9PEZI|nr:MFS transporter [Myriangium duriaei CBS 260.36]